MDEKIVKDLLKVRISIKKYKVGLFLLERIVPTFIFAKN